MSLRSLEYFSSEKSKASLNDILNTKETLSNICKPKNDDLVINQIHHKPTTDRDLHQCYKPKEQLNYDPQMRKPVTEVVLTVHLQVKQYWLWAPRSTLNTNTLFLTPCVCGSRTRANTDLISALRAAFHWQSSGKTSPSKARAVSILAYAQPNKTQKRSNAITTTKMLKTVHIKKS